MFTRQSRFLDPRYRFFAGFVFLFAFLSQANSAELSELEVYKRCYIRMVRAVPKTTDANYQKVASGAMSASDACLALFDSAAFTSSGVLKNRTDDQAKRVLKTFHDLHGSWFSTKSHTFGLASSALVRDVEEPQLYFTRAAFGSGVEFKSIATLDYGLQGVRDQATYPNEISDFKAQRFFTYNSTLEVADANDFVILANRFQVTGPDTLKQIDAGVVRLPASNIVEQGELVGVKRANDFLFPDYKAIPTNAADLRKAAMIDVKGFNANAHLGAGIMGSQSFFLANMNLDPGRLPNGDDFINRRITSKIFEDLMCHQLPTLLDVDVANEVKPTSAHTFQQQTSCMRCHSSIDGLGYTLRNFYGFNTTGAPRATAFTGIGKITPAADATTYAVQPPKGTLHYRELLSGHLKKANLNSLSDFGAAISENNDIYLCAAKRYYQFFTGINVNLDREAEKELDLYHQTNVKELGMKLKTTQSVRALMKALFETEVFRTRNYMTELSK